MFALSPPSSLSRDSYVTLYVLLPQLANEDNDNTNLRGCFNKYLLNSYSVLGTILVLEKTVSKADNVHAPGAYRVRRGISRALRGQSAA